MIKSELVEKIVQENPHLFQRDVEKIVTVVLDEITEAISSGKRVELRGFGTFGVKHRMPKKARNPGTGDAIYLPERFVPTFKPSKIMRSRVNELIKK